MRVFYTQVGLVVDPKLSGKGTAPSLKQAPAEIVAGPRKMGQAVVVRPQAQRSASVLTEEADIDRYTDKFQGLETAVAQNHPSFACPEPN